jgi:fructose-1-phosphate kinase PfkB-like protein
VIGVGDGVLMASGMFVQVRSSRGWGDLVVFGMIARRFMV